MHGVCDNDFQSQNSGNIRNIDNNDVHRLMSPISGSASIGAHVGTAPRCSCLANAKKHVSSCSCNRPGSPVSQLSAKPDTCVGGVLHYNVPLASNQFAPLSNLIDDPPAQPETTPPPLHAGAHPSPLQMTDHSRRRRRHSKW